MSGRGIHGWTGEQEEYLRQMMSTPASYGEITSSFNAKFGTRVSRSAILAKCDRMGVRGLKVSSKSGQRADQRPAHRREARVKVAPPPPSALVGKSADLLIVDDLVRGENDRGEYRGTQPKVDVTKVFDASSKTRKPFLSLRRGECKWPAADDASMACGAKVTIGSYCTEHAQVAYRTMPTKSRNRKVLAGAGYLDTRRVEHEVRDEQTLAPDLIPSFLPEEEAS